MEGEKPKKDEQMAQAEYHQNHDSIKVENNTHSDCFNLRENASVRIWKGIGVSKN